MLELQKYLARWLSWLERRPVTAEVVGSIPIRVVLYYKIKAYVTWGLSSAGRASALQAEGHRFEPCRPHLFCFRYLFADVAQLAEQLICNQQVNGSSPFIGCLDGFPSGQRGQTVNLLSTTSKVRILPHPLRLIRNSDAG